MSSPSKTTYGKHKSQYVEHTRTGSDRTAVLIHGGYWRSKYSCDLMHPMAKDLAENNWDVLNLEYRRVGEIEDPWAAMASDIIAGISLASANKPMVFVGHSAGGHLALWAARTTPIENLSGVAALAPLADLVAADAQKLSDHACAELFGADPKKREERLRLASPIERVPIGVPQLIVHGSADTSVPEDQSARYAAAARAQGDPIDLYQPDGVDHFQIIDPDTPVWRYTRDWMTNLVEGDSTTS